jgi:hypothetical protein
MDKIVWITSLMQLAIYIAKRQTHTIMKAFKVLCKTRSKEKIRERKLIWFSKMDKAA